MILYQTVFVFAFIIYCLFSSFTCQYKSCYTSFLFLFYSSLKPWSAVYSFIPSSVGFSKNINIVYAAMISFHFIIFKKNVEHQPHLKKKLTFLNHPLFCPF